MTTSFNLSSYSFVPRWRLEGNLTVRDHSGLHVGSGLVTHRDDLLDEDDNEVDVDAMPLDDRGRVYLPGSTIKGVVRSWLQRRLPAHGAAIQRVFGNEDQGGVLNQPDGPKPSAGKVEFTDAPVLVESMPGFNTPPPFWDETRSTGVRAAVAIDRRTRTAEHGKLFYHEYVPPGVSFRLAVGGEGLPGQEALLLVLAGLEGFNDLEDPVVTGARTHDGWGRFVWKPTALYELNEESARTWWNRADQSLAFHAFVESNQLSGSQARARTSYPTGRAPRSFVRVQVKIEFHEGFLVRDHGTAAGNKQEEGADPNAKADLPDATPLRTVDGHVLLPARSVRGVLRSQAERILRTLYPKDSSRRKLIEQIFGKTRHRTALEFTEFRSIEAHNPGRPREFVAIDRFTGGVAGRKKFNAEVPERPTVIGAITLNLDRLQGAGGDTMAALALLTLVVRDLIEGDLSFGMGRSKGLGSCTAELTSVTVGGLTLKPDGLPHTESELNAVLAQVLQNPDHPDRQKFNAFLDKALEQLRPQTTETPP
jgi:CRISPR/Cas system CSM-associated protein Csm3 (group 7 of RAMP superfamily)